MPTSTDNTENQTHVIGYLTEFRQRCLRAIAVVALIATPLLWFANPLYRQLADPLLAHLPAHASLIATQVAAPFIVPMKLALVSALFLAAPYWLYQLWAFVAPALYQQERRLLGPVLASSIVLFYSGIAFAYSIVLPLIFRFLTSTAPQGVTMMTDIGAYLDFVLTLFFAFGFCFEIPVIIWLLCWTGCLQREQLQEKRPYIVIAAFTLGMLLTPPDVVSQVLLAVPIWLLYELGLLAARLIRKQ